MSFTIGVKEKISEKISNTSVITCVAIKSISFCVAASPIFLATNTMMGIIIPPSVLSGFFNGDK